MVILAYLLDNQTVKHMPLGGSGAEMQKSLRDNRNLGHRRKPLKQLLEENTPISTNKIEYTFKQATPEEMLLLKKKVVRDKRRSICLRVIAFITLTLLGILLLQFVFSM
ncbi:MAG: hypothetical protein HEP71_05535 [Roseivirga sp.]|nr:hypothetical protein [Roseivirga sp.]